MFEKKRKKRKKKKKEKRKKKKEKEKEKKKVTHPSSKASFLFHTKHTSFSKKENFFQNLNIQIKIIIG